MDVISKRYASGWRWCGNVPEGEVTKQAKAIAKHPYIKHVRITEAYYPNCNFATNQCAIWIQYRNPIPNNGETTITNREFTKDIK